MFRPVCDILELHGINALALYHFKEELARGAISGLIREKHFSQEHVGSLLEWRESCAVASLGLPLI
jgi:hypothetical protein